MKKQRILVCTFVAIASSLTGAYLGGQGNLATQTARCDRSTPPVPGLSNLCQALVTPFALTEGGLTGLWCGMVIGAFFSGLATQPRTETPRE
jgi:hypothetical protein